MKLVHRSFLLFPAFSIKIPVTEKLVQELRERVYLSQRPSLVVQDPPDFLEVLKNEFYTKTKIWNAEKATVFNPDSGLKLAEYNYVNKVYIYFQAVEHG